MSWNFRKNTVDLMKSFENLNYPDYHKLKFWGNFDDFTWKFAQPLLSQGKLFPKIKQFCWCDLKIWPAPIITNWNFWKKWGSFDDITWKFKLLLSSRGKLSYEIKTIPIHSRENLTFPYYYKLKFSRK